MCEECKNLIDQYYPDLSNGDQYELLFGATCFPFGGPESIEPQLKELIENTDGSLQAALCYANNQLDESMKRYKCRELALPYMP